MGTASTKKFIKLASGTFTEEAALTTSAGAGDAQKIPALNAAGVLDSTIVNAKANSAGSADAGKLPMLDASGRLDTTMMPVGIGADTSQVLTSEALSAGNFVNIYSNAGVFTVRKADATVAGKEAHGFVLAAYGSGVLATVYFENSNTALASLTPGVQYLSIVAGTCSSTPPSASGNVVQRLGVATSASSMNFESSDPVVLA